MSEFEDPDLDFDASDIEEGSYTDDPVDSTLASIITQTPLDLNRLAHGRQNIGTKDPIFLEMIDSIYRLQQSHGDADPALSHALSDIDMTLRVHVMYIHNDPLGWLLSIITTWPEDRQRILIQQMLADLHKRLEQLS